MDNATPQAQTFATTLKTTKSSLFGGQQVALRQGSGANSAVYYLHGDHPSTRLKTGLGSTSLTTDANGALVSQARYTPFGGLHWASGEAQTDFGFTGQRAERGMGLMDYQARFYAASLGRFVSADTVVPGAGNPMAWDRYAYVFNSPLKYTDPSGHDPYWCEGDASCQQNYGSSMYNFRNNRRPLPPSFIRMTVTYADGGELTSSGVIVDTNAILTHNHHLSSGETPADISNIIIENSSGQILIDASSGEFLMADPNVFGGGVSLFVFSNDFADSDNIATIANPEALMTGSTGEQAVTQGGEASLYPTYVAGTLSIQNTQGVSYDAFQVSPDQTAKGDSGAPFYMNGYLYGINNSGSGFYAYVPPMGQVRELVSNLTAQMR